METKLRGKTALVTGATGGLGRLVTRMLLEAGAKVAGLAPQIQSSDFQHPSFLAVPRYITDEQSAKAAIDEAVLQLEKLEILVHLVGGFAGGKRVDETGDATWQRMFDLNLNSAFLVLRAA